MERLSVYMCLKTIKMEGKYGKFVSAGYQSIQYFKMANEQDLADLTLNSEEIEVFTKKYLLCPATSVLVQYELLDINIKDKSGCTPLHWAARNNNADVCRSLLRAGCKKNATDNLQRTPLHLAALGNSPNCVRVLIKAKAKKNPRDRSMNTPIMTASSYNSIDAILLLCKMGCNPTLKNRIGETAKSIADRFGNILCKEAIDRYAGEYDSDSEEDFFSYN